MKIRHWTLAAMVVILVTVLGPPAQAAPGLGSIERLAVAQTQLLFKFYNGQPQFASPQTCSEGQDKDGTDGVFLLPTLSFVGADMTFRCKIATKSVLVDLGGAIPTEDDRASAPPPLGPSVYELKNGKIVPFTKDNLQTICRDLRRFFPTPAPATLDGHRLKGVLVTTRNFTDKINKDANDPPLLPFFQDSKDLGHPGRLTSCYTGHKALVVLKSGDHVITVDLSGFTGTPAHFTYKIQVR